MKISILGTRGIPAKHGGFETFAERLALHLVGKGWEVTVHCPALGADAVRESEWCGIRLLHLPVHRDDAVGTILFDWKSTLVATGEGGSVLNLGYGTAIFGLLYRLRGIYNVINMDGIEWRRKKWSFPARAWLYLNERAACLLANHLIADHPEIKNHLATRVNAEKIAMIPYGADPVADPDVNLINPFNLTPNGYAIVIARPDPDNSILEIVRVFSARKRGIKLVILGNYHESVPYQKQVLAAASSEVVFAGGIYDKQIVEALRFFARLYVHGHKVGGTNPSLVEALAAGSPVLAHDNHFNREVAGPGAAYFGDERQLAEELNSLLGGDRDLEGMRQSSRRRHSEAYTWEMVLSAYEGLLARWQGDPVEDRNDAKITALHPRPH
ncbi:MAG: glycosyl transferase [Geobacteraceae bacterium GWC2_58_44]|nr:MAG: glycosyl transferase [Geobacteraceae bacterium GWC2_58_44]HBG05066.1 glycosyl transferase [Geobacter sp.]